MYKITLAKYNKIHTDFRGTFSDGTRSAFNASIRGAAGLEGWGDKGGTELLAEGIDFEIVPLIINIIACEGEHKTGVFYKWSDAQKGIAWCQLPDDGSYEKVQIEVHTRTKSYSFRAELTSEYSSLEFHFQRTLHIKKKERV